MLSRVQCACRARDRGSVSVFTAFFAFAVLLLVALLVDGGSALNARERANDIAEQAARAAATDLDTAALRAGGTVTIDWTTACGVAQQSVDAYAKDFNSVTSAQMTSCVPGADQRTALVTVVVTVRPLISGLSFDNAPITATQSATAACGNADQQEAC